MIPALLFTLAAIGQDAPAFTSAQVVPEPIRLALTPSLDGRLSPEEWDPFQSSGDTATYFQWEPGKLHVAGKLKSTQDLVASFDLKGDGWLVGADNLEVRLHWNGSNVDIGIRMLDCTRASAPGWINADGFKMAAEAVANAMGDSWFVEATIADPGVEMLPTSTNKPIGMRIDAVDGAATLAEPYLPRLMSNVNLAMERASNIPEALKWHTAFDFPNITPGDKGKLRLTFNGTDQLGLKRIEMRTEGLGGEFTQLTAKPFPMFDRKKRAYVDYETEVKLGASLGYRILRANLLDSADQMATIQTSYQIAPLVSFDVPNPGLKMDTKDRQIRLGAYIRSNSAKRLDGYFHLGVPAGWTVAKGDNKRFIIYNSRNAKRQVFEVIVPGGTNGTFPMHLVADIGEKHIDQIAWLTIGP